MKLMAAMAIAAVSLPRRWRGSVSEQPRGDTEHL